ncbi:MAG: UDP-N-acetylmuramoyl-L-alanine--D-glutamate ligase [Gemmatimonadetes bacterium]|nr:UDP-N-acetylmuramoyl-L-alanine--D-glutamate ligase [Gemmatimonadota bacterium]
MIPPEWLADKEVAVIGLGRTGVAASAWLARCGVRVYASDADDRPELAEAGERLRGESVAVDLGSHDLDRIRACAAVVVSPGVPPEAPPLVAAREAGLEVVSELDLAARALPGVALAVITGTNGKTTTTALVAHLLAAAGIRAEAAGNIGRPLIGLAGSAESLQWVVVEASSFQLHDSPHLNPTIGVLTNLAPDHLDRYPSVEAYYADKRRLFQHATDRSLWILNRDDEAVVAAVAGVPGDRRWWSTEGRADAWWDRASGQLMLGESTLVSRDRIPLLGDHNVANALAAVLVASAAGASPEQMAAALGTFQPLSHRLEPVRELHGVLWVNDSKATNVASTTVALRAMNRPFVLIAGGYDKGEDIKPLALLLQDCRRLIAYGAAAGRFRAELGSSVDLVTVGPLDEAVRSACACAQPSDAVLLSPACSSFDQFHDYEDRGDAFRRLVRAL